MDQDSDSSDSSRLAILVAVEDEAWRERGLGNLDALVRNAFEGAARRAGLDAGFSTEVGVTFTDDGAVAELNAEWRGREDPTNVLSFPLRDLRPGEQPGPMLGDLVLALQTVEREAEEGGLAPADHLRHLLVHGFLHLLGYRHDEDGDAAAMEALEIAVLADLGVADPYADTVDGRSAEIMTRRQAER